ncbi:unnamed protein product [Pylaiella littoralis]
MVPERAAEALEWSLEGFGLLAGSFRGRVCGEASGDDEDGDVGADAGATGGGAVAPGLMVEETAPTAVNDGSDKESWISPFLDGMILSSHLNAWIF